MISDTGFLLSVAATDLLLPILEQRWAGRAKWPKAVHSELKFRAANPGNGIPPGLSERALACGEKLAGTPLDLDDEQRDRADLLATAIGGTETGEHAGEAAGAVLARDMGGVLASEDRTACVVIQAREGVDSITIRSLLHGLHRAGALTAAQIDTILDDLRDKGRPNVVGLAADDVIASPRD